MVNDPRIRAGVFAGESGGDYNALFGYQNRPNGRFSNINLTSMPISDVLAFTDPSGPYAQYVKSQVGRVATPVGAYQVVGTTLRDAVNALGIDPSTPFNQATQDRIGQWILETQGTGAWEGYNPNASPIQISTSGVNAMPMNPQQPQGLLGYLGIQQQDPAATDQTALPFYQRDRFKDTMGNVAMALNSLRLQPDQALTTAIQGGRDRRIASTQRNATADWLQSQPNGSQFAQMLQAGADPAQVLQAYQQYQAQQAALARGEIMEVDGRLVHVGADRSVTELMPKAVDPSKVGEMRREFNALPAVKDFDTFSRSYGSMVVAASDHTGPADMALIFNYMKMLDPNSTVREGEYATAQNSGGASDRFRSLYNSIVDGQTLTNNQRDQFMNVASNIYTDAQRRYQGVVDQYTANATAAGYDPERVITQYGYTGPEYQAQIPLPQMPSGITVDGRPATQEEWDYYWGALSVDEQKRFMETGELPND